MGTRRRYTPEYRRDVVSLVLDTGSTIASVARDLGLGESVVGRRLDEAVAWEYEVSDAPMGLPTFVML